MNTLSLAVVSLEYYSSVVPSEAEVVAEHGLRDLALRVGVGLIRDVVKIAASLYIRVFKIYRRRNDTFLQNLGAHLQGKLRNEYFTY